GQAWARIDLHERTEADPALFIDAPDGAPVADSISEDEGIRLAVEEGYVPGRTASPVVERGGAEYAVLADGEYDQAVGVRIRSDRLWLSGPPRGPRHSGARRPR